MFKAGNVKLPASAGSADIASGSVRSLDLARRFGVAGVFYKDESERFGLKSFKALGGTYAVYRLLAQS